MDTTNSCLSDTRRIITESCKKYTARSMAPEHREKPEGGTHNDSNDSPPMTQLRVLCLHDAGSSAAELKEQLSKLAKRLYQSHGIDLLYVNSPLNIHENPEEESEESMRRVWWEQNESQSSNADSGDRSQYRGLDASLLLARQVWTSTPVQGVIGVGQGAAIASFLCLLPDIPSPPRFAIFIDGHALLPDSQSLVDQQFPCLHLISSAAASTSEPEEDAVMNSRNGELLAQQFSSGEVHRRPTRQLGSSDWNAIGKFLLAQKASSRAIVGIQTALELVESEAANTIAQQIAKDPPASLMAIIQPNAVGGWSGNKRRQPHEQGGGAPCPSEFLLHREKRSANGAAPQEGPNRSHPSSRANENVE